MFIVIFDTNVLDNFLRIHIYIFLFFSNYLEVTVDSRLIFAARVSLGSIFVNSLHPPPPGLTAKISRRTFPAGHFASYKPVGKVSRSLKLNFSCTCQLSSSSFSSSFSNVVEFFFFFYFHGRTEHLGARRRVRLVRRVAGSQWTTSGGKKRERERERKEKGSAILWRVFHLDRSKRKWKFSLFFFHSFSTRKLDYYYHYRNLVSSSRYVELF